VQAVVIAASFALLACGGSPPTPTAQPVECTHRSLHVPWVVTTDDDRAHADQPLWIARALAERTFVEGVTTHLSRDEVLGFGDAPTDVLITLVELLPAGARFELTGVEQDATWSAKVTYDTRLARVLALDVSSPAAGRTTSRTWSYPSASARTAPGPRCVWTLHVPFRAPVTGERATIVATGLRAYEATREVLEVVGDAPTKLVYAVRTAAWQPAADVAPVRIDGQSVQFALDHGQLAVTRDGKAVTLPDPALAVWLDELGHRNWVERLVTDRDFPVGVASTFARQRLGLFDDPSDVRITLRSRTATEATFDLDVTRATTRYAGTLVFDVYTARALAFTLRDPSGGVAYDLRWTPLTTGAPR